MKSKAFGVHNVNESPMYFTECPYNMSLCPEVLIYLEGPDQCTNELTLISGRKRKISL